MYPVALNQAPHAESSGPSAVLNEFGQFDFDGFQLGIKLTSYSFTAFTFRTNLLHIQRLFKLSFYTFYRLFIALLQPKH